jgi:hypothetical protein
MQLKICFKNPELLSEEQVKYNPFLKIIQVKSRTYLSEELFFHKKSYNWKYALKIQNFFWVKSKLNAICVIIIV